MSNTTGFQFGLISGTHTADWKGMEVQVPAYGVAVTTGMIYFLCHFLLPKPSQETALGSSEAPDDFSEVPAASGISFLREW